MIESAIRNKLRLLTKTSIAYTAYLSGMVDRLAAYRTGIYGERQIIFLGYHRVVEDFQLTRASAIPSLLISAATLARHIELAREKFEILSLDEAVAAFHGHRRLNRDAVVFTFDDGYCDFYQVAFPVLKRYRVPATIYISSGPVGSDLPLLHDQIYFLVLRARERAIALAPLLKRIGEVSVAARVEAAGDDLFAAMRAILENRYQTTAQIVAAMMSELGVTAADYPEDSRLLRPEMVRELARAGITIGAHTSSHVLLTNESRADAEREIRASKVELEAITGEPVEHFAYPDGRYDPAIIEMVAAAGFRSGTTIEDRPNRLSENVYAIKRKILWERTCAGVLRGYSKVMAECQLRGLFANPAYKIEAATGGTL